MVVKKTLRIRYPRLLNKAVIVTDTAAPEVQSILEDLAWEQMTGMPYAEFGRSIMP